MTTKEYNALRHAIYEEGAAVPEIRAALDAAGIAYLYDVHCLPDKHAVLVLTDRHQLNDNTLTERGLDPATADVTRCLTYHRQTRCVTFD